MIHSALVAEQSHDLESLVNGSMQEASSGTVIWEDWKKRICKICPVFLYWGLWYSITHYNGRSFPITTTRQGGRTDSAEDSARPKGAWEHPKIPFQELKDAQIFRAQLPAPTLPDPFNIWERPRWSKSPEQDYRPVFLAPARLYVLAEKYNVKTLKAKVLQKLHLKLAISIYTKLTLDLIRYTYANSPTLKRMDQLRGLLIHLWPTTQESW